MTGRRLMVVLAIGAVALSLPADVGAKKQHKKRKARARPVVTVTQTVPVPSGTEARATASCPAGTGLTGGGFASSPAAVSAGSNFVLDSHQSGASGWTVRSINTNPAVGSLTVDAYCRRSAPALTEVAAAATLPASSPAVLFPTGFAVANCPGAQYAVAGGFTSAASPSAPSSFAGPYPYSSSRLPSGSGWRVDAVNNTSARNFTSLAYCVPFPFDRAEVLASVTVSGVGTPAAVDATCPTIPSRRRAKGRKEKKLKRKRSKPRPTLALSGGFATAFIVGPSVDSTRGIFVNEARILNGVWHVAGVSFGGAPAVLTGTAECSS